MTDMTQGSGQDDPAAEPQLVRDDAAAGHGYRVFDPERKEWGEAELFSDGRLVIRTPSRRAEGTYTWQFHSDSGAASPLARRYLAALHEQGRRYALLPWESVVVASLPSFLSGFAAGVAKDLTAGAAKAASRSVVKGAAALREHVRRRAHRSSRRQVFIEDAHTLLVVADPGGLGTEAWRKLVRLDFPEGAGHLSWNQDTGKWDLTPWQ